MSWEIFRCDMSTPSDNCTDPTSTMCISEALYQGQADAMVAQGFAAGGMYKCLIHILNILNKGL